MTDAMTDALQSLLLNHMPSMDHVAVLLAIRAEPDVLHQPADIARQTRLEREVIDRALRDLLTSRLVQRTGEAFRYAPPSEMVPTIDALDEMYHTRPVTLVRALYDRPARAVQSFADAFRLRKAGE